MRLPKKGVVLLLTLLFSVAATWIPLPFPSTGWKPWIGTALWLAVVFLGYLFLESEFESVRQFRTKTKHYVALAIVFFVFGSLGVVFFALFQSQQEKGKPPATGTGEEMKYYPGTGTIIDEAPPAQKTIALPSPPAAAMAVPGEIGWNFSSFSGMSSGAFDPNKPAPQIRIQTLQSFGRNIWSSTITKIEGYVEIDGTGDRLPLLFNQEGKPVDLTQMPAIEIDERIAVVCYFTQDRSLWNGSWQGLEPNIFLDRYTPFTFVVSINGGKERKYPFPTEDCRVLIQSFIDSTKP